jgi:hypothetical protein
MGCGIGVKRHRDDDVFDWPLQIVLAVLVIGHRFSFRAICGWISIPGDVSPWSWDKPSSVH